jgi:Kef-type K+ transport system membrane component KefB
VVALAVIVAVTRAAAVLAVRAGQPPVIGELVGGIVLGPSVLGWMAPALSASLFPPHLMPVLARFAQAGVVVFMFLVGLELQVDAIRRSSRATLLISYASIVVPFAMGVALAFPLYQQLTEHTAPFTPFAMFIGVSMSVTAFPVLARILRDRGLLQKPLGVIALACAAVDDVTAWILLALVVSIAKAGGWWAAIVGLPGVVDEQANLAFAPGRARFGPAVHRTLGPIVTFVILPVFFAFSGLRTQIRLLDDPQAWLICGSIIAVACIGKFGGGTLAARATGYGWRDAASLGVLMNTRGLVELIVLNAGLDLGVISPRLFTMLVIMALVTTFMTSPALRLLR